MNDDNEIMILKGADRIRRKLSIFGWDTSDGLLQMLIELLDWCFQDYWLGKAKKISVEWNVKSGFVIETSGADLPEDVELADFLFDFNAEAYEERDALVRSSIGYDRFSPNHILFTSMAVCRFMNVTVSTGRKRHIFRFERGDCVETIGITMDECRWGLRFHFLPDENVFSETHIEADSLSRYCSSQAALSPGVKVVFNWDGDLHTYYYPDGVAGYLAEELEIERTDVKSINRICFVNTESVAKGYRVAIQIALAYSPGRGGVRAFHNLREISATLGIHAKSVDTAFFRYNRRTGGTLHQKNFTIYMGTVSQVSTWKSGRQEAVTNRGIYTRLTIALMELLRDWESLG